MGHSVKLCVWFKERVTGKFGLGMKNGAGQRLIDFCQDNALVIANTLFQQHKRRLYTWTSPDGQWRRLSAKELMLLNCGVGEDSWESLDCKEIQSVHSEGDQPWDFFGKNDAKAEAPVLWPPHAKSWLIGKDSAAGRDWGHWWAAAIFSVTLSRIL